jgi:allantoinase
MPYDLIVRGGDVVTADAVRRADIAVKDGRIAAIGAPGALGNGATIVDATGKVILPGVIDVHLHAAIHSHHVDSLPVSLTAAARGGVTSAIVHLLPSASAPHRPLDLLREFRDLGRRESVVDFSFHAWLPEIDNIGQDVQALFGEGIPSFKLFLAYKSIGRMASDAHLLAMMETIAREGGTLLVHAEDGILLDHRITVQRRRDRVSPADFRWTHPEEAEWLSITKAILYARLTGCRLYVVHVSTPRGAELIAEARDGGQPVWAETCPQYLELTDEEMERWGPLAKISPPLRDRIANAGLWRHLAEGRIQAMGSDHSPHSRETKAGGYRDIFDCWYGAPGVQTMLPVMWDAFRRRNLPLPLLARVLSDQPARIFGLDQKGAIAPGMDADFVIIDPELEREIRSEDQVGASGYSLYHGRRVRGWPVRSFLRGRPLLEGDTVRQEPGYGIFVPRRRWDD